MKTTIKMLRTIKEHIYDAVVFLYYAHDARKRNRKYVVMGNPMVGIGNRLIALANTYSWYGKENITLVWAIDHWVPKPFETLFEMSDAPGFEVISHRRHRWSRYLQIPKIVEDHSRWWHLWAPQGLCRSLPEKNLRCLYNQTPQWAREVFSDFFAQLRPSPKVCERIESCILPPNVVCVQIRNTKGMGDIALVASLETFFSQMEKYERNQRFFVSCMSKEISEQVHARFGERVFELPNKDYGSMIDAVADMWLLGSSSELICQFPSTFSEVAWWWHGGKSKVIAIPYEYRQSGD